MRVISGLILSLAIGVFMTGAEAFAQDVPKAIAIQVVIGADGAVKVIDASTGKAIDASVIQLLTKPGAIDALQLDKNKIDELRKALERALEAELKVQPPRAVVKPFAIELELRSQPKPDDAKPRTKADRIKRAGDAPAGSVDKKLDLILKQLDDLRKDVDGIKKKLEGKQSGNMRIWELIEKEKKLGGALEIELFPPNVKPAPKKEANKDEPLDPAIQKALEFLRKTQTEQPLRPVPTAAQRLEELQRALERIRQEIDTLKSKEAPKSSN